MRGFIVEMTVIVPMVLMMIVTSIWVLFYSHDKNIISGAAYETVVIGAGHARRREGITPDRLETVFRERIQNKCLFFGDMAVAGEVDKERVKITVIAEKRGMKLSVEKSMSLTDPEKKVREIKRLKEIADGENSSY